MDTKSNQILADLASQLKTPGGPGMIPEWEEIEQRLSLVETATCDKCGETFEYHPFPSKFLAEKNHYRKVTKCDACKAKEEEEWEAGCRAEAERVYQRERIELAVEWTEAALPRRFRDKTFETFSPQSHPALRESRRYVQMLIDAGAHQYGSASLMLASTVKGTGKTHLACAIGRLFMEARAQKWPDISRNCPVCFTSAADMFLRIQATYRKDAEETEADILKELGWAPLVILDDIGNEKKASEHTRSTYYSIVNTRYNADLPIVMTSNLILGKQNQELEALMGDATLSRLKEMTDGWRIMVAGTDHRFGAKA